MSGNAPGAGSEPAASPATPAERPGPGRGSGAPAVRRPAWRRHDLAASYDVVVAGLGVQALALAYHLAADHGVTDVAVVGRGHVGTAPDGAVPAPALLRPGGRTPETVRLHARATELLGDAGAADAGPRPARRRRLRVARDEAALHDLTWQTHLARLAGVEARLVTPAEIARLEPALDLGGAGRPVLGGLLRPDGAVAAPDVLARWYARAAAALGVHVHHGTELVGVDVDEGRVRAVRTSRGRATTPLVVAAEPGGVAPVCALAGVRLPVVTYPAHVLVTEPAPAFLRAVVDDASSGTVVGQTDGGEVVVAGDVDPYPSYSTRATFEAAERLAAAAVDLVPGLGRVRAHWQATASCDLTPDRAPIVGRTPVEGFLVAVPGGPDDVTVAPACGEQLAVLVATGVVPALVAPFGLDRFAAGALHGERDPAWVGVR